MTTCPFHIAWDTLARQLSLVILCDNLCVSGSHYLALTLPMSGTQAAWQALSGSQALAGRLSLALMQCLALALASSLALLPAGRRYLALRH